MAGEPEFPKLFVRMNEEEGNGGSRPRMVILFVCPACGGNVLWKDARCRLCEGELDWSKVKRPKWFDASVFE